MKLRLFTGWLVKVDLADGSGFAATGPGLCRFLDYRRHCCVVNFTLQEAYRTVSTGLNPDIEFTGSEPHLEHLLYSQLPLDSSKYICICIHYPAHVHSTYSIDMRAM